MGPCFGYAIKEIKITENQKSQLAEAFTNPIELKAKDQNKQIVDGKKNVPEIKVESNQSPISPKPQKSETDLEKDSKSSEISRSIIMRVADFTANAESSAIKITRVINIRWKIFFWRRFYVYEILIFCKKN